MKPLPGYPESDGCLLRAEKLREHVNAHDRPVRKAAYAGCVSGQLLPEEACLLCRVHWVHGPLLRNDHPGRPMPLVSRSGTLVLGKHPAESPGGSSPGDSVVGQANPPRAGGLVRGAAAGSPCGALCGHVRESLQHRGVAEVREQVVPGSWDTAAARTGRCHQ
jgi:hypothetical protein